MPTPGEGIFAGALATALVEVDRDTRQSLFAPVRSERDDALDKLDERLERQVAQLEGMSCTPVGKLCPFTVEALPLPCWITWMGADPEHRDGYPGGWKMLQRLCVSRDDPLVRPHEAMVWAREHVRDWVEPRIAEDATDRELWRKLYGAIVDSDCEGPGGHWATMLQTGWNTVFAQWIDEAVPVPSRRMWNALRMSRATNAGGEEAGRLLLALIEGTDRDRERKAQMTARCPLAAPQWLLDREGRNAVTAGEPDDKVWTQAARRLTRRCAQARPLSARGLKGAGLGQWGQRMGWGRRLAVGTTRAPFEDDWQGHGQATLAERLLAIAAQLERSVQPRSQAEWAELAAAWCIARRIGEPAGRDDGEHERTRELVLGFRREGREMGSATRIERAHRMHRLADEALDAIEAIRLAVRSRHGAAAAREIEPELGAVRTLARMRRMAGEWERAQAPIEDHVARVLEHRRATHNEDRITWISPDPGISTVEPIGSCDELLRQGTDQNHCIGGYMPRCLKTKGNVHVYRLGKSVTGTTLLVHEDQGKFSITRQEGYASRSPDAIERRQARQVLNGIRRSATRGEYDVEAARWQRQHMHERVKHEGAVGHEAHERAILHEMAKVIRGLDALNDQSTSRKEA